MGILNVTPDSFSDGGQFAAPEAFAKYLDQRKRLIQVLLDGGKVTHSDCSAVAGPWCAAAFGVWPLAR